MVLGFFVCQAAIFNLLAIISLDSVSSGAGDGREVAFLTSCEKRLEIGRQNERIYKCRLGLNDPAFIKRLLNM